MKFSTIITIIASVAVGSANASTSFLRSTIKEEPDTVHEHESHGSAACFKECLTVEGRAKKAKDLTKNKVADTAEACFEEHCDGNNRSIQETGCLNKCAERFSKGVERAVEKAIDDCEDKCVKSCSSPDDDETSGDDCERECEKECEKGSLDGSVAKKADKGIERAFASGDECIDACFEEDAPAEDGSPSAPSEDYDYETLKIA